MKMISVAGLGLMAAVSTASAVQINPNGTGQVLIYPVYDSRDDYDTLLTVTNETDRTKALKVKLLDGGLGQETLVFNVYLGAFDTWTAAVTFDGTFGAPASILTNDSSCTVPEFPEEGEELRTLLFDTDPLPNGAERTRFGHVEVYELGELTGDALALVADGDCAGLVEAWSEGGFWVADADTDMAPPTGGLAGTGWLVSVLAGEAFGYEAVALTDFTTTHLNNEPGSQLPDLSSGDSTTAVVMADDGPTTIEFEQSIDAVSAALTATAVAADFTLEEEVDGQAFMYLTMPTFKHYVSELYAGANAVPRGPFAEALTAAGAPTSVNLDLVSRNGLRADSCADINTQLPPSGVNGPVQLVASVSPFLIINEVLFSNPSVTNRIRPDLNSGRIALQFGPGAEDWFGCSEVDVSGVLSVPGVVIGGPRDGEEVSVSGLPVVGIMLNSIANGFLTDDIGQRVLSNYGVDFKLRRRVVVQ